MFLHSFKSFLPAHCLDQKTINAWIVKAHERVCSLQSQEVAVDFSRILARFCVGEDKIAQRYYECPDVSEEWGSHEIYRLIPESNMGATIEGRNRLFGTLAVKAFENLYQSEVVPEHLIHVTCTGYVSPSPAQTYFSSKAQAPAITHAYHMGCYASLPAVRMARASVLSKECADVDIVHTEMCSLHLDPSTHTPEQLVVQSLFGDGHIKYRASLTPQGPSLRVLAVKEKLLPQSTQDMTWIPGPFGMKMTLSREVPAKIKGHIQGFVEELCSGTGLDAQQIMREAIFAVHPGGPKIIDGVREALDLRDEQVQSSLKVLRERGNMSSATLPHVWKDILEADPKHGQKIVSLAFGPGLTIFGGLFDVAN